MVVYGYQDAPPGEEESFDFAANNEEIANQYGSRCAGAAVTDEGVQISRGWCVGRQRKQLAKQEEVSRRNLTALAGALCGVRLGCMVQPAFWRTRSSWFVCVDNCISMLQEANPEKSLQDESIEQGW